jgi:H+/Cl- antiporter ClcA
VLPAASITGDLASIMGGLAAAMAIGAFIGQAWASFLPMTEVERRRFIAVGGLAGLAAMSGLFLLSYVRW